jgi:hypothetical protein
MKTRSSRLPPSPPSNSTFGLAEKNERSQESFLAPSAQLEELANALELAQRLYGSPKAFTRLALENPRAALSCALAAKKLTGALREIQALA